eukprot:scaffold105619_cov60-Phaeocystis_antarctica.AAC.2
MALAGARSERSAWTSRAACCSSLCFGLCGLAMGGLNGLVGALTDAERDRGSTGSRPRLARVSSEESRCVPALGHMQSSRGTGSEARSALARAAAERAALWPFQLRTASLGGQTRIAFKIAFPCSGKPIRGRAVSAKLLAQR